jgi:hypothetical protein
MALSRSVCGGRNSGRRRAGSGHHPRPGAAVEPGLGDGNPTAASSGNVMADSTAPVDCPSRQSLTPTP